MSKQNHNSKNKQNPKNKTNDLTNVIIAVSTAVLVVTLICLTIIISKSQKKEDTPAAIPQTSADPDNPFNYITTYENTETSEISETDSKTLTYFNSHYKDDYYKVNEIMTSAVVDGNYTEYYETRTTAYSTDGYLYEKVCDTSYLEQDLGNSIITLHTPENSYIIYPDMGTYFMGEGNMKNYTNTIDFPADQFKTGTVNINGKEYYYEEYSETIKGQPITYKYCFDEADDLRFRITSSSNGTITERYVEYSKDVDYSLFKIPEDYTLER